MSKRRLIGQLYPSYLVVTVLALAALLWYAGSTLHDFYLDRCVEDLRARALLLDNDVRSMLVGEKFAELEAFCKEKGKISSTRITVVLPDGRVVADSDESPAVMENHGDREEIRKALAGSDGWGKHFSNTLHETRIYVAIPLCQGEKNLGALRTSFSYAVFEQAVLSLQLRFVVGGVIMAACVAVLSWWLSRRIVRPLEELKRGAERFASGDLAYRLPQSDCLEINSLAVTLNDMAAELESTLRNVLRKKNERDAILTSMVEGVLAFDAEERLIRMNAAAARLFGCDPDKAEGRTLQEIVRNAELQRLVKQVMEEKSPAEGEMKIFQHGERLLYLYVHAGVLQGATKDRNGVLVVLHDVTQLKKLETIRRDFVANVSHELRTPVTSIKGFIETLLSGAMHNPEDLERFLKIVAVQSDRLNAIIEDLLTLSRLEQEQEKAEIEVADESMKDIFKAAVEVCQLKAAEKHIQVEISCPDGLQAAVNAPLLEQAVINLLDNAIKFSSAEQKVELSASRTETEVVLVVRDNGSGISSEHLSRIFERFYRVDKARSRKLGGTGLGLAIVKHIAHVHGGYASVESTVGKGSSFSIHLPIITVSLGTAGPNKLG